MDYSVAGLIGSGLAVVAGLTSYFLTVPLIQKRLREIGPTETPEQRQDLEFKLGVMRRLILTMDIVVFGLVGYFAGQAIGG
jgi:hypothetical protein